MADAVVAYLHYLGMMLLLAAVMREAPYHTEILEARSLLDYYGVRRAS